MPAFFRTPLAAALAGLAAASAQAASVQTGNSLIGTVNVPQSLTYSHTFTLPLAGFDAANDTFYDDYLFTVGPASFSSLTATLDLGQVFNLSNLQARLYTGTTPTTGLPSAVGATLMQAWRGTSGSGSVVVINPIDLSPGSYVLEVRGRVTGSVGGSYVGVMNFAPLSPIGEPNPYVLGLAGIGLVGFMARRQLPSQAA